MTTCYFCLRCCIRWRPASWGQATGLCDCNLRQWTDNEFYYKLYLLVLRITTAVESKNGHAASFRFRSSRPRHSPPPASTKRFAVFPFLLSLEFSLSLSEYRKCTSNSSVMQNRLKMATENTIGLSWPRLSIPNSSERSEVKSAGAEWYITKDRPTASWLINILEKYSVLPFLLQPLEQLKMSQDPETIKTFDINVDDNSSTNKNGGLSRVVTALETEQVQVVDGVWGTLDESAPNYRSLGWWVFFTWAVWSTIDVNNRADFQVG